MNLYKHITLVTSLSASLLFTSCASNEIGQSKDVNPETVYQQYHFVFTEGDKNAEITAWFRFAGENGTTLELNSPGKFEYDGIVLQVDSSDFEGAFYQSFTPPEKAIGKHTLLFTGIDSKQYENSFSVDSFTIAVPGSGISKLAPAQVKFTAPVLQGEDYIELTTEGTDSSFTIKHTADEKGDYCIIPVAELQRQKKNEFSLIATLHRKLSLQQQTKQGGEIITRQTLKPLKLRLVDEKL
ncbi:MAG: hypothetical protein V4685_18145 [Bacteroidota bacterium]